MKVAIESPCDANFPVNSVMYWVSFSSASCFAIEAGPSVFSFLLRTRRPFGSVVHR